MCNEAFLGLRWRSILSVRCLRFVDWHFETETHNLGFHSNTCFVRSKISW